MKLKQRAFFAEKLGVELKNPQWSWGAFDPVSNRVFLRIWKNLLQTNERGERVLLLDHNWTRDAHGYRERLNHLAAMERGAQGVGILCEPRIAKNGTWHIKDYDDEILVKLGDISREDRVIYAAIIGRFPIGELMPSTVKPQKEGSTQKITRICFNSHEWQRPSGDAKKHESSRNFNPKYGFGHEEWLFRSEWLIDGWRYAFIQGVNKSSRKLLAAQKPFDLTVFTVQPDKRRRYVATIREIECIGEKQAEEALKIFKKSGWFGIMQKEIKEVGGNAKALGNTHEAKQILNVRFRLENVLRFKPNAFARLGDPIMNIDRYQLRDFGKSKQGANSTPFRHRKGSASAPSGKKVIRQGTTPTEYTPEHALMQKKLLAELKQEFPEAEIIAERDFIDVSVHSKTELLLFEIKSDLEPRAVIRQALGQILEYAFHPQRVQELPVRLVIVGRRPLSCDEKLYIEYLCEHFRMPLQYRVVAI